MWNPNMVHHPRWTEAQWLEWLERVHREVGVTPALREAYEFYLQNYSPREAGSVK